MLNLPARSRFLATLALFPLILMAAIPASAQSWEWAQTAGNPQNNTDTAYGLAVDPSGNTVVVGQFFGSATFANGVSVTSAGQEDVFYAKYSPTGNLLWASRFGGTSQDIATAVATDGDGNIYITGYFIGSLSIGGTTLQSPSETNGFLAKFNANGGVVWARQIGGWETRGLGIAVNTSGRIWVTGVFTGRAQIGSTSLESNNVSEDVFLASFDTNGNPLWTVLGGSANNGERGSSVTIDSADNAYLTGRILGFANFSGVFLNGSNSSFDAVVAKYDSSGTIQWATRTQSNGLVEGRGIAVDSLGQTYVTGEFYGTASFGNTNLTGAGVSVGNRDVWAAKLSASGSFLWALRGGAGDWDEGRAIAIDAGGNSYLTGYTRSNASGTFGSLPYTVDGSGSFVVKVSPDGEPVWIVNDFGGSFDIGYGIAVDATGAVTLCGMAGGPTATFGNFSFDIGFGSDIFVARLASDGSPLPSPPLVSGFSPGQGSPGSTITIFGSHLTGTVAVYFNNVPSPFFSVINATQISAVVPEGAATGPIRVTTIAGNGTSANLFVVTSPVPSITDFSPRQGSPGDAVTIVGTFFSEATAVTFNGLPAASFTVDSAQQITAVVPEGAVSGPIVVTTPGGSAQGPLDFTALEPTSWQWAVRLGDTQSDMVSDLAVDGLGRVAVAGYFTGSMTVGHINLSASGASQNSFVALLGAEGQTIWARNLSGVTSNTSYGPGVAVDASGNVLLTGWFSGTVSFGGSSLSSAGSSRDLYVAKYSPGGTLLWVRGFGGFASEQGRRIAVNRQGEIYVAGIFDGTNAVFGNTTLNGTNDPFLLKLNANGQVLWVRQATSAESDELHALRLDRNGNPVITGTFLNSINFSTTALQGAGSLDVFLAKYSPDGDVLWARRAGGPYFDLAFDLAIDLDNHIHLTGSVTDFGGEADFGSFFISGSGSFLALYDADGTALRARSDALQSGTAIAVDEIGSATIGGALQSSGQFGSEFLSGTGLALVSYATDGAVLDTELIDGIGGEVARALAFGPEGELFLAGTHASPLTLGSIALTHSGSMDGFVAKRASPLDLETRVNRVFTGAVRAAPNSTWFGLLGFGQGWFEATRFPWIYHLDLGWVRASEPAHEPGIALFSPVLGWLYIHPDQPGFYFRYASGQWLAYAP